MNKKNKYKLPLTGKALLAVDSSALLSAGFSASALRSAGFSASDVLSAGFSASDVRSAGFSASALRSAGFSASALLSAGFSASDVRSAGFSASALLSAGFSASDVLSAGFSASDVKELEALIKSIPKLKNPYSQLWKDLQDKKRCHQQSEWGPSTPPANVCGTPMCTAGHLVNMAGIAGYKLKDATSWRAAALIIHQKVHPDIPHQNFGNIPQENALEYIKQMAEIEEGKDA